MQKTDLKKTFRSLFAPPRDRFVEVDVPMITFVKVDGAGDPNKVPDYRMAVETLYGVSYAMKFASKSLLEKDYVVPPLQGLWWADDPAAFVARQKDAWRWTMMIMVPDFVTADIFDAARARTSEKRGGLPESLRLEAHAEGLALQTLHIGSYEDEAPTLARLHDEVMPERGVTFAGPHHEIYLSDPRRTAQDKLKTILRQPVRPLNPST